jgi:hypothetical protein
MNAHGTDGTIPFQNAHFEEQSFVKKTSSNFQIGRLPTGGPTDHIVVEKDYITLATQQIERKMIDQMGLKRFESKIKTSSGKKEFNEAVSKKVGELREKAESLVTPPLNHVERSPSKVVIGSPRNDRTNKTALKRIQAFENTKKLESKVLSPSNGGENVFESQSRTVTIVRGPGQAPYSLNEIIEKANVECTKSLRSTGTTATAPIRLVGLNKGINPKDKVEREEVHYVGIFKYASEGEIFLKRQIEKAVKGTKVAIKLLGMRRPTTLLPGQRVEAKAFSEKFSYDFSKKFGFKVVPETNFAYIDKEGNLSEAKVPDASGTKLGTIQVFAKQGKEEGFKDARVHVKENRETKASSHALIQFQKCAILSYIMGGIDCHLGNVMSQKKENEYSDFTLIDNGNSFFEEFPDENDKLILANYCGWVEHPLSRENLDPDVCAFIKELTSENIVSFMQESRKEMSGFCNVKDKNGKQVDMANVYFSEKMIKNTLLRIEVVKKLVDGSKNLQDLAKIKTEKQTKGYLSQNIWKRINGISIFPSKEKEPVLPELPDFE